MTSTTNEKQEKLDPKEENNLHLVHSHNEVPFGVFDIESDKVCTKEFSIIDGEVDKRSHIGISRGVGKKRYFSGISEYFNYHKHSSTNALHQSIFTVGMPVSKPSNDGTYPIRSKKNSVLGSIGLTKKDLHYQASPGLIVFDNDPSQQTSNRKKVVGIEDGSYINCINSAAPELGIKDIDRIENYSNSAGVVTIDKDGSRELLKKNDGCHIQLLVSDATAIPEILYTLKVRLVLQDEYYIEPNKLGQGMVNTCIDDAPRHPFTPRITSGPKINTGCTGKPGTYIGIERDPKYSLPKLVIGKERMLDVAKLKPLTKEEELQYKEKIKFILAEYNQSPMVARKIAAKKSKLIAKISKELPRKKKDIKKSVNVLLEKGMVTGDWLIYFDDEDEPVNARVLAGSKGEQYDGATLHDIYEPSPENKGTAIFYWNEGENPYINCLKHGGYGLKVRAEEQLSSNDWMNRHHAQVFISNKMFYAVDKRHTGEIALYDDRLSFISAVDLKAMYAGEHAHDEHGNVITDSKEKPYGKVDYWLKWSERNKFNSIAFVPVSGLQEDDYDPLNLQSDVLNLYTGFAVTPVKGDVTILLDYILKVICNGDEVLTDYVTKWIARMVQKPHLPAQTALVIKSKEGTGKTLFWCVTIGSFFGRAFFETANGDDVLGNFNGPLANVVYVNFNEATFAGNKTVQGKLKQLITDESITIRKMYQEARQCKNYAHFVFTSNNSWVVGVGESDRRFVIFEMAEKQPKSYYKKYVEWLNNGGRESALDYFLNDVDISGFDPRDIPAAGGADSESKLDQQLASAGNMINFMLHLLTQHRFEIKTQLDVGRLSLKEAGINYEGDGRYSLGWVPEQDKSDAILTIQKDVLYEEFIAFCRSQKWGSPPNMITLGRFLKGSIPGEGDEVFAIECQKFKDIYPTGKRWQISLQVVVKALNSRLNTTRIGHRVDIWDVISSESRFPLPNYSEEDFLN